jgi:Sigma-70 region 2
MSRPHISRIIDIMGFQAFAKLVMGIKLDTVFEVREEVRLMSLSDDELAALFLYPSRLQMLTDEDLMAALRIGCNDAFAVLYERYSDLVFRTAREILHDDGEAQEMVDKVFMVIFRTVNQFDPDRGTFKTWLLQYFSEARRQRSREVIPPNHSARLQ